MGALMEITDAIVTLMERLEPLAKADTEVPYAAKVRLEPIARGWRATVKGRHWEVYSEAGTKDRALEVLRDRLIRDNQALLDRIKASLNEIAPRKLKIVAAHKDGA